MTVKKEQKETGGQWGREEEGKKKEDTDGEANTKEGKGTDGGEKKNKGRTKKTKTH